MANTRRDIIGRLKSEFGYEQAGAQLVADDLEGSDPAVRRAFLEWLTSGRLPILSVEGFDVPKLMREHGMNVPAALLTLDWLLREPKAALASLRRGHDRVAGKAVTGGRRGHRP